MRPRTVASRSYTHRDIFRMEAFRDGHICSGSQVVCVCVPSAMLNWRPISAFSKVSNTNQTAVLNFGDDGQRLMVIAVNRGADFSSSRKRSRKMPRD